MDYTAFKEFFALSLQKNGLPLLLDAQNDLFYAFAGHLLEVNRTTNLTAIRNMPDVITKHFVDSLLVSQYIPKGASVLDLGCGAGFPSIPLAIARPDLFVTALDSTSKKIAFVNGSVKLLNLSNLSAVAGRAEDPVLAKRLGLFDVVTSRAVARLNILSELCMPYVRVDGTFLPLKAAKAEEELFEAKRAISFLGGDAAKVHPYTLITDAAEEPRCVIEIRKKREVPKGYPRAYAAILKKPL
ncbi:MAG: 16S rRNA (guanine(527)-N(7))-methyltransferase RsmG [Clostridia bacterium]|nr:16S rRNA (guanine(527)-N(7))-methyltransferase RsmG [Clostridia bacterium]